MWCVSITAGVQSWVASLTEAISNSLGVAQHPTADISSGVGEEANDAPTLTDRPMAPKADKKK